MLELLETQSSHVPVLLSRCPLWPVCDLTQKLGVQSRSPTWVGGTKLPEASLLPLHWQETRVWSWSWEVNPGTMMWPSWLFPLADSTYNFISSPLFSSQDQVLL